MNLFADRGGEVGRRWPARRSGRRGQKSSRIARQVEGATRSCTRTAVPCNPRRRTRRATARRPLPRRPPRAPRRRSAAGRRRRSPARPTASRYMPRRASPAARSTPENAIPSPIRHVGRHGDGEEAYGHVAGLALRLPSPAGAVMLAIISTATSAPTTAESRQRRGGEPPRLRPVPRAQGARHDSRDGDDEADIHRHGEEPDRGGEADAGRDVHVLEPGDVEQRQEVHGEDRQQARPPRWTDITTTCRKVEPRVKTASSVRRRPRAHGAPPRRVGAAARRAVARMDDVLRLGGQRLRLRLGGGEGLGREARRSWCSRPGAACPRPAAAPGAARRGRARPGAPPRPSAGPRPARPGSRGRTPAPRRASRGPGSRPRP